MVAFLSSCSNSQKPDVRNLASEVSTKNYPKFCGYKTSFNSNKETVCEFQCKVSQITKNSVEVNVLDVDYPWKVSMVVSKPKKFLNKIDDIVTVIGTEFSPSGYEGGWYYQFKE